MAKVFTIDISKCSGCYNCQLACKDEHAGNEWLPYAAAQPEIGQFWMKVEERVEGTLPKVKIHYLPRLCNHCEHPACMAACPQGAIEKRADGLVLILPEKCSGCGDCAKACPYGVIYPNAEQKIFQKCTGCAHLLDHGIKQPRCVEACPTEALRFGEESELRDELLGAEVLRPETGLHPHVYYRNLPGLFIGGTLYDPETKEVIIGARCLLTNGGRTREALSDDFGDFWFRDLPAGVYTLLIQAKGYAYRSFERLRLEKSMNLGDISLQQMKE